MKHPGTSVGLRTFFCTLPEGLTAVRCLKTGECQFSGFRVSQTKTFTTNIPSQVSKVGTYPYIPIDHRTPAQGKKKITLR